MKKLFSIILISIIIIVPLGLVSASASTETPISVYTIETEQSSGSGYADYKYVDANGNEVVLDDSPTSSNNIMFFSSALPSSYDSRTKNCITTAKNQGRSGNCWAFAAISALESDSILQGIDYIDSADYSEAHFVWFNKNSLINNANDTTSGDGCTTSNPYSGINSGGNWKIATESLARWSGLAEDSDYPFYPNKMSAMGNYDESSRYDTGSNIIIKSSEVLLGTADTKQWIIDHGSVTATYYSDNSYLNSDTYAYYYNGSNGGNHQIVIVGWDDSYSVRKFNSSCKPSKKGAWLCKNSWGDDWGLDGYFWLSYADTSLDNFVGFTSQEADAFCNNYSYNGAGWTGTITAGTSPQIANVFKAEGNEILSAISTYTATSDTDLTISIYKNLPSNYTAPNQGELAVSWTTNVEREGYHTIELPSEVALETNTIFSVVIKMQRSSGYVYIPVEMDSGKYVYKCNSGESFLNSGGAWSDITYFGYLGLKNVCIQAFTEPEHQTHTNKTIITPATCSKEGCEKVVCTVCGETISETVIPKLDHKTETTTVPATCTENGIEKIVCTLCGETISETVIPKLDHETETTTVPATCTENGIKKIVCTICGETISETVIPKLDHKTETTTVPATCTENGAEKTFCTVCGEVINEKTIRKTGHSFGEWSEYIEDAETGKNISTRHCDACGATETKTTSAIAKFFEMIFSPFILFFKLFS